MNPFVTPDRILVHSRPQDMRAGIVRLAETVACELGRDPADGTLFVFISRDRRKLKMLRFECSAWCMWHVRLARGALRWTWDEPGGAGTPLERRQLLWLLEGLSVDQPQACAEVRATRVV
jgi:hypothetical protein